MKRISKNLFLLVISSSLLIACGSSDNEVSSLLPSVNSDSSLNSSESQSQSSSSSLVEQITVTVTDGGLGGGTYNVGDSVTVYAEPEEGQVFDKWLSGGVEVSSNNPYTFIATVDITLTPTFNTLCHLTVNGGEGTDYYTKGTSVTVTATVPEHQYFVNWTCGEEVVSTEEQYTFIIATDLELTANFDSEEYTVSVQGGTADVESGVYGTEVTLTPSGLEGYAFEAWKVNGVQIEGNTFILSENSSCEAIYVPIELAVSTAHEYFVDTNLVVPTGKIVVGDEIISATAKVIYPDKTESSENAVELNQKGTYRIEYTGTFNDAPVVKTREFNVVDQVSYISAVDPTVVSKIVTGGEGAYGEGIYFSLGQEDVLYCNEIIDLSSASFAGNYVIAQFGFKPNESGKCAADTINVRLTDVDNPTNYITIAIANPKSYGKTNVYAYARGQELIVKDGAESIPCDMTGENASEFQTNLIIDYATRQIAAGNKDNVVADLDDADTYGENVWNGFTTGKVYLSIFATDFEEGEESGNYSLGYVADSRGYSVTKPITGKEKSSRDGVNFEMYPNSVYSLDGYHATLPTVDGGAFYLLDIVFMSVATNATLKVKIIDTQNDSNFIWLVIQSDVNGAVSYSVSTDGNPGTNKLYLNKYMVVNNNSDIVVIWEGASHIIKNNSQVGGATNTLDVSGFTATNVRFEFVADQHLEFKLDYLGDKGSTSWPTYWQD